MVEGPEYLTTREVADLLRLKERRVYDLAAAGEIPCTRAVGKLLFQRTKIDAWLSSHQMGKGDAAAAPLPKVMLGSHDPLLDWALRESRCGIATFFDGSFDGLNRFMRREGLATGLHIREKGDGWNVSAARDRCGHADVVLVEWAWRDRGLMVAAGNPQKVAGTADLSRIKVVPRQSQSGSQTLLLELLEQAGIDSRDIAFAHPARTESDAAAAVAEGQGDAALGLRSLARQYGLDFIPLLRERFDLLVDRAEWFEPPLQRFLEFTGSEIFLDRAGASPGYDVSGLGRVHFNASSAEALRSRYAPAG